MSEWKKVKLGEISQIIDGDRGKNYPKNNEFHSSGYCMFLNTGNVTPHGFSFENNQFISEEKDEQLRKGKLLRGDLIYTTRGTVGNVAYYDSTIPYNQVRINSGMVILRVGDKVNSAFLYQLLRSKSCRTYFKSFCTGSAQPQLPIKNLSQISFEIPPLFTQHRIATILSRYDSLIENYQKQIKLLEETAQRLYKEWFVDLHFPGHENTKIVDGVPEGWEYRKIGDVYKTVLGGTPSRAKSNYWGGDIPWINSGEINKLRIIQASEMITQEGYDNSSTKLMPVHTTILAITGATLGQVSYTEIETCANQSVVGIIDETNQTNEYLYLYINDNILSIVNKATGGAQQHINKDIVNDYNILIPVQNVLALFKERTTPLFKLIKDYLNSIQSLTEARDRLLPKLMSGELKV